MARNLGTVVLAVVLVSVASLLGLLALLLAGEMLFGVMMLGSGNASSEQQAGEIVAWTFLLLYSGVLPYTLLWLTKRRTALARSVAWTYVIVAASTAVPVALAAFGAVRPTGGLLLFGFDPAAHGIVVSSVWALAQSVLTLAVALYWLRKLNQGSGRDDGFGAVAAHG